MKIERGQPSKALWHMPLLAILAVLILNACTGPGADSLLLSFGSSARDIDYDVTRNKRPDNSLYLETEAMSLSYSIDSNGSLTIEQDGDVHGPIDIGAGGNIDEAPLIALFLLSLTNISSQPISVGDTATARIPADDRLSQIADQVVIQLENSVTLDRIADENGTRIGYAKVAGRQRLIDNDGLRDLIGQPDGSQLSDEAEDALKALGAWNFYLTGEMRWDEDKRAATDLRIIVSPIPAVRLDQASLESSSIRNEVIYDLSK